jgi:hypothetical protein
MVVHGGTLTAQLRQRPPLVHGNGEYWGLAWPVLEWLEAQLEPGMTTLETGAGASTVVFAARGCSHVAVSPDPEEHRQIAEYCRAAKIDLGSVRFLAESSHTALAGGEGPQLDLVLIDGAHSFPWPSLDWFNVAPRLRVGGRVLVDDAYLPAVNVLVNHLRKSPSWRLEGVVGYRTPVFIKLDDEPPGAESHYKGGRFGRQVRFDYLPPHRRLVAWLRSRFIDRSPLAKLVRRRAVRRSQRAEP